MSLGHHSTSADCAAFLHFLEEVFLNRAPQPVPVFEPLGLELTGARSALLDADSLFLTPSPHANGQSVLSCEAPHEKDLSVPRPIKLAAIFVYPIKSCAGAFFLRS